MHRGNVAFIALVAVLFVTVERPVSAQMSGGQVGSGRTSAAGGSGAAGSASTLSQTQGYGLDNRFTGSGFSRYMSGSSTMGQTTAGAGAATAGAFGQGAQGQTGQMGAAGGQNRFGNLGTMGSYGGLGYGFSGMGGMMGMRNMFNRGMQQNMGQQQGKVRTHMRLGFDAPARSTAVVNARFASVVNRVLERPDMGGGQVTVSVEGSTAVLSGTVTTEHARDVIERLAMLEPGIAEVRNELLVNPAAPTPATGPTSSTEDRR